MAYEQTRLLIADATASEEGRNMTTSQIGAKLGISVTSARQLLEKERLRSCKESTKRGMTEVTMRARYEFAKLMNIGHLKIGNELFAQKKLCFLIHDEGNTGSGDGYGKHIMRRVFVQDGRRL